MWRTTVITRSQMNMKTRWKAGLRWLTTCMLTTDCILPQPQLFFPTAAKLCLGWADQRLCRLLNQFQLGFHINWPVSSDIDQHKLWLPEFIQQITMNLYIFNKYFKHLNWWSAAVLSPEPISAWFWFFFKLTSDTNQHKVQPPELIQQITLTANHIEYFWTP